MANISIIGAGYSGLLAALKIGDVKIYEENKYVGIPPHCTGLVSYSIVDYLGSYAREVITNEYSGLRIFDSSFRELFYLKPIPRLVRLDRVRLESLMMELAINEGSRVYTLARVSSVGFNRDNAFMLVNHYKGSSTESVFSDLVIVAEGVSQSISSKLGLVSRHRNLYLGVQGYVDLDKDVYRYMDSDEDIAIILDDSLFKSFFAWIIPLSGRKALVGFGAPIKANVNYNYRSILDLFLIKLYKRRIIASRNFKGMYGGLIIRNAPSEIHYKYRSISIGDAAGMVKPFSGGGLYPIAYQVNILHKLVDRYHNDITRMWSIYSFYMHNFIKQLKVQELLTNILAKIGLERAFKMLTYFNIIDNTEYFNFDYHFEFLRDKIKELLRVSNRA